MLVIDASLLNVFFGISITILQDEMYGHLWIYGTPGHDICYFHSFDLHFTVFWQMKSKWYETSSD